MTAAGHAAEVLTPADQEQLKALANGFSDARDKGDERSYPNYIEDLSLRKLMEERRSYLTKLRGMATPEGLAKIYEFKPDVDTVLAEKDPAKYFAGVKNTEKGFEKLDLPKIQPTRLVSIAGDRTKAYLVMGEPGDAKKSPELVYRAWPAILTAKGWRLDVTTILLDAEKPVVKPAEKLRTEDEKELAELFTIFLKGRLADFPRIMDETTLKLTMMRHQASLKSAFDQLGEYKLKDYYTFTPDLKNILREKDPVRYFSGIQPTPMMEKVKAESVNRLGANIVGFAGDRKVAYILVEELPAIPDDLSPELEVCRALHDDKGWHLDIADSVIASMK